MQIIRHPKLAADIRTAATHYGRISERVLSAFWKELDTMLASIAQNPKIYHFDSCGMRRPNLRKFPYHLLFEADGDSIYLVVLRHDRRHPDFGLERRI